LGIDLFDMLCGFVSHDDFAGGIEVGFVGKGALVIDNFS
jgi:hypothetical protein